MIKCIIFQNKSNFLTCKDKYLYEKHFKNLYTNYKSKTQFKNMKTSKMIFIKERNNHL